MIEHYLEMLGPETDQFTQGMVTALIKDLRDDKTILHSQRSK